MSDLAQKAAESRAKMDQQNPGTEPGKAQAERKRIPLSVPQRKLEVPDVPGYHLRWIRGTPQRLRQAEQAGYEYVTPEDVQMNDLALGGDGSRHGSTDMGSRVSVVEGSETDGSGNAIRMYLMKQKLEFYREDQEIVQRRNNSIANALTSSFAQGTVGGQAPGETQEDVGQRYVDKSRSRLPDFFRPKRPK